MPSDTGSAEWLRQEAKRLNQERAAMAAAIEEARGRSPPKRNWWAWGLGIGLFGGVLSLHGAIDRVEARLDRIDRRAVALQQRIRADENDLRALLDRLRTAGLTDLPEPSYPRALEIQCGSTRSSACNDLLDESTAR